MNREEEFFAEEEEAEAEAEAEAVVATPKKVASYKAEAKKYIVEPVVELKPTIPGTTYAVVSGEDQDKVYLSKATYKNLLRKRSLTIHHIQRRLKEWGFFDAYADTDGFYGDFTKKSVTEFQEKLGLEVSGLMDAETLTRLFEGDTNVLVHLT
jgi:hypothetical protein